MELLNNTLALAMQLIAKPSLTPDDQGCQQILAERLEPLGFNVEHLRYENVDNLWAQRGNSAPLVVLLGHTDVVPPGPLENWTSDPFSPTVRDGKLFGRGAADMKSSVAAFIIALEQFITDHPHHPGSIGILITSDEEGPSINGTRKVIELLQQRKQHIDYCIVGEASSEKQLGDTIKVGRRGSLSGELTIYGKQGHVAYPARADNPIHRAFPALLELSTHVWDHGNEHFTPTSLQMSNIHAGYGANNVIPGELQLTFNFRYAPVVTVEQLKQQAEHILQRHQLRYELQWIEGGLPFYTRPGTLTNAAITALQHVCQITPTLSTTGGTSDGRFLAPTGTEVVEIGPINQSIHQINEHITLAELANLPLIYKELIKTLLL